MSAFTLIQIILAVAISLYMLFGLRLLYTENKRANARVLKRASKVDLYEAPLFRARLLNKNSALATLRSPMPEQQTGTSAQQHMTRLPQMTLGTKVTGEEPNAANDRSLPLEQHDRGELQNYARAMG
jgi:hypothetical protein